MSRQINEPYKSHNLRCCWLAANQQVDDSDRPLPIANRCKVIYMFLFTRVGTVINLGCVAWVKSEETGFFFSFSLQQNKELMVGPRTSIQHTNRAQKHYKLGPKALHSSFLVGQPSLAQPKYRQKQKFVCG